jgi:hypothetical protein
MSDLSRRQHGVFGLDQMRALGLASPTVRARVAAGRLHRIHHGVYSLVPKELLKREGLYMAAVLACGPSAVLSHRSAAALLGLRDWGATKIEVTVPRSSRRHEGIAVHSSTTLTAQDIAVVNNIPCTSIARTLLDLAEVVTHRQLERAFDQAEIAEVFDLRAIEDVLARNPTRRGVRVTRPLGIPDPETNAVPVLEETVVRRSARTSSGASSEWCSRRTAGSGTAAVSAWRSTVAATSASVPPAGR